MTEPDSPPAGTGDAGEEISKLAGEIASKLPEASEQQGIGIEAALAAVGVAPAQAAFVAERLEKVEASRAQVALHAAFLALLLDPGSALARVIREISASAHRRTAGALVPYVERDDLLSLFRWRLFELPGRYFASDRLIRQPGLRGFLATVARNLAIDEVRRLAGRTIEVGDLAEATVEAPDVTLAVFDAVRRAFDRATKDQSPWLADAALALLLETRDRAETLTEINRRRAEEGLATWSPNALAAFLKRLRASMRHELGRD